LYTCRLASIAGYVVFYLDNDNEFDLVRFWSGMTLFLPLIENYLFTIPVRQCGCLILIEMYSQFEFKFELKRRRSVQKEFKSQ